MSKATQKAFEEIKGESVGLGDVLKGVKEFVQDMAPGLTLEKVWEDVKHEAVEQTKHGAHELSAALFTGSAFVMYPRAGHEDVQPGQEIEAPQTPEKEQGGMER